LRTHEIRFPVTRDGLPKLVSCRFATGRDAAEIRRWSGTLQPGDSVEIQDAAEYAELATNKWEFYRRAGRVVASLRDIQRMIHADENAEVLILLVASAPWFAPESIIAFCMARRTWANNLCIDFLAAHPDLLRGHGPKIKGSGTGLMYAVCEIAQILNSALIWGEATQSSHGFYQHYFPSLSVVDQFNIGRDERLAFMQGRIKQWSEFALRIRLKFAKVNT
jgi:hypothetical protein